MKKKLCRVCEKEYPAVIAIEREDVLLEDLSPETSRIYYFTFPLSYERYYGWLFNGDPQAKHKYQKALKIEKRIYRASEVVIFAWSTYESFVRKHVYDGANIVSHPGLGWYGCGPQECQVQYHDALKMVYLGHIFYWSNPELLAELTNIAPFPIHAYDKANLPFPGV